MAHTRRDFLFGSGCLALSGAAFASTFNKLSLINLLAQANSVNVDNYKALVCIFLFGGNDSNNLLIPYDNFDDYFRVRGAAGFAMRSTAELLGPLSSALQGQTFGLPARSPYNVSGIRDLYVQGKLALVANVGTLVVP